MLSLVPGMSLTGWAAPATAYAGYVPTAADDATALAGKVVKFNGYDWYLIADNSTSETEGTVTLLAADNAFGTLAFKSDKTSNSYNQSEVKAYLDGIVAGTAGEGKPDFKAVADAIQPVNLTTYKYNSTTEVAETTENAKLYLLSTGDAQNLPANVLKYSSSMWWLRSPGNTNDSAAVVSSSISEIDASGRYVNSTKGVRPALKLDLSKVKFDSTSNTFSVPTSYPLWVGETQVTSANLSGTGWSFMPADGTTPAALTLSGATISTYSSEDYETYGIFWNDTAALNIVLAADTVNTVSPSGAIYGIYSNGAVAISGAGTLTAEGTSGSGATGIYAKGLTISDGTVNFGGTNGISCAYGYMVTISGGTVTATGDFGAISGSVKNAIAGIGWENKDGSGNSETIAISDSARSLSSYQKVWFTPHTHNFTNYSVSGASITATCSADGCTLDDGQGNHTATITVKAPEELVVGLGTIEATVEGEIPGVTTPEIVYNPGGNTAPTAAGTYTASITIDNATASVEFTVREKEKVSYLDETGEEKETADTNYTLVRSNTPTTWTSGWYVVDKDVTITSQIQVTGNAKLILTDGATLTAEKDVVCVGAGKSLTIYGQSGGTGALIVEGDSNGILLGQGPNTINGGNVVVTGKTYGINIGSMGNLVVNGGTITANGSRNTGAGIYLGGLSKLTINGGDVTSSGGGQAISISSMDPGKLILGTGLQVKAGASETDTIVPVDTFTSNIANYKWASIGRFHTHSFGTSYALSKVNAENDSITATCTDDLDNCNLAESDYKATITIAASTEGGGKATLLGDAADFGLSNKDIAYTKNGTPITEAEITNSGFYKASITVGDKTAFITYGVNEVNKDKDFNAGDAHGDFTVPAVATANATVTIPTTPDTGYELDAITVKNGDNTVASSKDGDNGTFTMPEAGVVVSATFKLHDYTITKNEMTNGNVTVANTAKMGDTVTLTVTPATGYELDTLTVKDSGNNDVTVTNNSFTMPASDITVSATFKLHDYTITKNEMTNGSVTVANTAKMGDNVSMTVTPDAGYEVDTITVLNSKNDTVTVTENAFTMPASDVNVSATFKKRNVPVVFAVSDDDKLCEAELLTDTESFASVGGNYTRQKDDTFILRATAEDDYDYTIKFNGDAKEANACLTKFTEDDYKLYADYLSANSLTASAQTELYFVTMPGVADDALNIEVRFAKTKSFTILYQPAIAAEGTETVWCKFTDSENKVYAAEMTSGLNMNGKSVWSVTLKSAFDPSKIAFVKVSKDADNETLKGGIDGAALTACSAQTNAEWKTILSDKYMVIGENAKAVTAVFADGDTNAQFEIGVCAIDGQGNVTAEGTVKAPKAPAKEGFTFGGWRGVQYDGKGKASEKIYAAEASIPVRGNTTLSAVWNPITSHITLNLNGGTGATEISDVAYQEILQILENPEKNGFVFNGWNVGKNVTENGKSFSKGSPFDFTTPITNDLKLDAQWKHVHSYTCVPLDYSAFGDKLSAYYKYLPYLHVKFCGCADVEIEAHTFKNGVCTGCGYTKPGATEAKLEVFYWKEGASSEWMAELPETVKVNEEVQVSAYWQIDDYQFSKWQYSTDNGQSWKDLSADNMIGFIIPCSMQVRAIYVNTITDPQISLSARNYVTEAQGYNWDTVLYQMEYKLPDGYTCVDAGIRMGDNEGISYYEIKEIKQSTGEKAAEVGFSFGFNMIPFVGGGLTGFLTDQTMNLISGDDPQYYYEKRENSVLDELTAATLSEYMLNFKPVNVDKYEPIYWESKVTNKGRTGSLNTLTPLRFIQKNNGNHYIYGMAYLKYKTPDGEIKTVYTEALPTTRDNVPAYTVKADSNGMTNTMPK